MLLASIAVLTLFYSLACAAQDKGYWRAANSSAGSVTGDIALSDTRISINFSTFSMVQARTLAPAEVSAAFDADVNVGLTGALYHLVIPATKRFLHRNAICGADDTQWMATFASGRSLHVAFFSGSDAPTFTPEAFANATNLCGMFLYSR